MVEEQRSPQSDGGHYQSARRASGILDHHRPRECGEVRRLYGGDPGVTESFIIIAASIPAALGGAVAGYNVGSITACYNTGTLTLTGGGIVGRNDGSVGFCCWKDTTTLGDGNGGSLPSPSRAFPACFTPGADPAWNTRAGDGSGAGYWKYGTTGGSMLPQRNHGPHRQRKDRKERICVVRVVSG